MDIEDNLNDRPRPDDSDVEDDEDRDEAQSSDPGRSSVNIDPPDGGGEPYTDP